MKLQLIYETMKTNVLFFLLVLNFIGTQLNAQVEHPQKETAILNYSLKPGLNIYTFTPLTDFDEFGVAQRVERINGLTGDNVTVKFKKNKVEIALDPLKTTGKNLERLLLSVVRLHGYESYLINQ